MSLAACKAVLEPGPGIRSQGSSQLPSPGECPKLSHAPSPPHEGQGHPVQAGAEGGSGNPAGRKAFMSEQGWQPHGGWGWGWDGEAKACGRGCDLAVSAPRPCAGLLFGPLLPASCTRRSRAEHDRESDCKDLSPGFLYLRAE